MATTCLVEPIAFGKALNRPYGPLLYTTYAFIPLLAGLSCLDDGLAMMMNEFILHQSWCLLLLLL